jgi:hypothetical protein
LITDRTQLSEQEYNFPYLFINIFKHTLYNSLQLFTTMAGNGQDLLDRCQAASNEAISKSDNLTSFIADSRHQLLGASNNFFGELLDLAVAIRGNYDKTALTPPVRTETTSKIDDLVASGEKIKAIADDAEKHVDTTDQEA